MKKPKPGQQMTLEQSANYYRQVRKYLYHRWAMMRQRGLKTDYITYFNERFKTF